MLDIRKKNFYPKGRNTEDSDVSDIKKLIDHLPLKRDMLIEYLHLIQDKYNQIRKKHLAALASILKIPMAEAFEVATFYAHFDVIEDDEDSLPPTTIRVCDSLTCELFGANDLMKKLSSTLDKKKVRVVRAPCMGLCDKAPACEVGHNHLEKFSVNDVETALSKNDVHPKKVGGIDFEKYISENGYKILKMGVYRY